MWLGWQVWGYGADYAKTRPLIVQRLGYRAEIALEKH
jgi:hypothetical protein